jgi:phenylacetate-coenzyme A ligase PaaK-like adenylate-forming protein
MPTTARDRDVDGSFARLREHVIEALLVGYPDHIGRLSWNRRTLHAHQQARLRELLAHARECSPFHARRLTGIDIDAIDADDLSALPVMTKDDLMGEFDDVVTDRRLTRAVVEAAVADTGAVPRPLFGEYLTFASGGSSGRRGTFVYDLAGVSEWTARFSRGAVAYLTSRGGPPPGGLPVAVVAASSAVHLSRFLSALTETGELPVRYLPVPVTLPVAEIVARLNALQPAMLAGYPSMLARLAAEQRAGRLRVAPIMTISAAETLSPDLRKAIRAGFGVPIIDSFASTEGLVGASAPDDEVITLGEDGCIVELIDAQGRPARPGTVAASALITNLTNLVQPLIRYDLTDSFVEQPVAATTGHRRVRVEGRRDDVFVYDRQPQAVLVHPLLVRSTLVQVPEIVEYHVQQTVDGINVTAVTAAPVDITAIVERLAGGLRAAGLADPDVRVTLASALPRDRRTGKLRRFTPLVSA